MKKYTIFILLVGALLLSYNAKAQLVQIGVRAEADMQGKVNFLHNGSVGLELDVNVPLVGVGISASAMYSMKYFDNEVPNVFEDLYHYLTIPINLKWNFGFRPLKLVVMAGPYISISLDDDIGKEELGRTDFNSTIYGINGQIGLEILKHYRISLGYKGDIQLNDLDDYVNKTNTMYLGLMYIF